MESEIVEVTLPNGATALVRARAVDGGGAVKTGRRDKFDFASVAATLEGVTDSIRGALTKAAPDSVSVELSFELAVKSGGARRPAGGRRNDGFDHGHLGLGT